MKKMNVVDPHRDGIRLDDILVGSCNDLEGLPNDSCVDWIVCDEEFGGPSYTLEADCFVNQEKLLSARKKVDSRLKELGCVDGESMLIRYWW